MDHLSFMFSLLLIVSVTSTTLGSAIKAKNPNGEELEPLLEPSDYSSPLMNSRDQVSEKRQITPYQYPTFIPGNSLDKFQLGKFLDELSYAMFHKIAIGIDNESGFKWTEPSYNFNAGISTTKLLPLEDGKAILYPAFAVEHGGVHGGVAYYIPGMKRTIVFMFHNDYYGKNVWNVKLLSGKERAQSFFIESMLFDDHDPIPAHGWFKRELGDRLKCEGAMTNNVSATLEIHVRRTPTSN